MPKKKLPALETTEWFDDRYYPVMSSKGQVADWLPSVTTILQVSPKEYLARWRGDIGNREADRRIMEAADRGSRVHHACELYLKGGAIAYQPPWNKRQNFSGQEMKKLHKEYGDLFIVLTSQDEAVDLWRFQRWFEIVKPKIVGTEVVVYNMQHRYAGRIDCIFDITEGDYLISGAKAINLQTGRYIIDLKTGSESDDHAMQLAAYYYAVVAPGVTGYDSGLGGMAGAIIIYLNSKVKTGIPGVSTHVLYHDELTTQFNDFLFVKKVWERKHLNDSPILFSFPKLFTRIQKEPKKKPKKQRKKQAKKQVRVQPQSVSETLFEQT